MSDFIGTKLTMNLGERSYDIILKNGALENLYQFARLDRKVAVVTDSGVPAEYAQRVADQCRESTIITVPQGEASKSFKILETVLRQMLEFNMGRGDLVVAVGGGVVGDLAGFAAAIYMRGIDFINCPTTTIAALRTRQEKAPLSACPARRAMPESTVRMLVPARTSSTSAAPRESRSA